VAASSVQRIGPSTKAGDDGSAGCSQCPAPHRRRTAIGIAVHEKLFSKISREVRPIAGVDRSLRSSLFFARAVVGH